MLRNVKSELIPVVQPLMVFDLKESFFLTFTPDMRYPIYIATMHWYPSDGHTGLRCPLSIPTGCNEPAEQLLSQFPYLVVTWISHISEISSGCIMKEDQ